MRFLPALFISMLWVPVNAQDFVNHSDLIKVAIIDTGVDLRKSYPKVKVRHFDGRASVQLSETEQQPLQSRHGSWITSVFLSNIKHPAEILSYRVDKNCLSDICNIYASAIARAALDAERRGAKIIQISSFGDMGPYTETVLKAIADRGTYIVMSSGNEGGTTKLLGLAKHNKQMIYVVGAVNSMGQKLDFSARDDDRQTLRWKRGSDITVLDPNGRRRIVQGTSYSASFMSAEIFNALEKPLQTPPVILASAPAAPENRVVSRRPQPVVTSAPTAPVILASASVPAEVKPQPRPTPVVVDIRSPSGIEPQRVVLDASVINAAAAQQASKMRSRAVRPDAVDFVSVEAKNVPGAASAFAPAPAPALVKAVVADAPTQVRSRAISPDF